MSIDYINEGNIIIYKSIQYSLKKFDTLINRLDDKNKTEFYQEIYIQILTQLYDEITNSKEEFYIENFNWEFEPYVYDHNLFSCLKIDEQIYVKKIFDEYLNINNTNIEFIIDNYNVSFNTGINPILIVNLLKENNMSNSLINKIMRNYSMYLSRGKKYIYEFDSGKCIYSV